MNETYSPLLFTDLVYLQVDKVQFQIFWESSLGENTLKIKTQFFPVLQQEGKTARDITEVLYVPDLRYLGKESC